MRKYYDWERFYKNRAEEMLKSGYTEMEVQAYWEAADELFHSKKSSYREAIIAEILAKSKAELVAYLLHITVEEVIVTENKIASKQ